MSNALLNSKVHQIAKENDEHKNPRIEITMEMLY